MLLGYLTTPVEPLKLCVQYCLMISQILMLKSLLPVASSVLVVSKAILTMGARWIAWINKYIDKYKTSINKCFG